MLQANHEFNPDVTQTWAVSPCPVSQGTCFSVDGSPRTMSFDRSSPLDAWSSRRKLAQADSLCFYANLPPVLLFIHPAQSTATSLVTGFQHPRPLLEAREKTWGCCQGVFCEPSPVLLVISKPISPSPISLFPFFLSCEEKVFPFWKGRPSHLQVLLLQRKSHPRSF